MESSEDAFGLEYLLALNGEIFFMDDGYWVKFEARLVKSTPQIPHGIRYSLTLHAPDNRRILGYDNAHPWVAGPFKAARKVWDHRHERRKMLPYELRSAGQLLEDFWREVDKTLRGHKS